MLLMPYTFNHKNSRISFENKLDLLKNNSVEVVKVEETLVSLGPVWQLTSRV